MTATIPTPRGPQPDARLADLDRQLVAAWDELLAARSGWAHSPNAGTMQREQDAQAAVDALLEQRYAAQPRRPAWR